MPYSREITLLVAQPQGIRDGSSSEIKKLPPQMKCLITNEHGWNQEELETVVQLEIHYLIAVTET